MLPDPRRTTGPVDDVRLDRLEQAGSRRGHRRDIDPPAAVEIPGIGPEIVHHPLEIVEDRQHRLRKLAGKRLPVNHLEVLVDHVEGPEADILATPLAQQRTGHSPGP